MENIIIIGMKNSGKSTLAKLLSINTKKRLYKIDDFIEKIYKSKENESLTCREIYKEKGKEYFRLIETEALEKLVNLKINNIILDTGGGTPIDEKNRNLLNQLGEIIYLHLDPEVNLKRILKNGIPAFFQYPDDAKKSFEELYKYRDPIYRSISKNIINVSNERPEEVIKILLNVIS